MIHNINGIEITPRNRTDIGIISDFTGTPEILQLSTDTIVLPREAMDIVQAHIQSVGLFEGIPYGVQVTNGVNLDFYIDLTDGLLVREHEIEVKIKKRKGVDNFLENANGTSFALMKKKGVNFQTLDVPYFIIQDNQLETGIMLAIALYTMTRETINAGQEVADGVNEVIQASTPNVGVPPSFNTGAIIVAALKAIYRIAVFALLLVALIELATKMFVLLFPPKRILKGIKIQELLTKGCQFLGYQFESTLLTTYPNYTILPVPLTKQRKSIFEWLPDEFFNPFNDGIPSTSDTVSTLGLLIDACKTMFNAEFKVFNGVVRMERWDYWQDQTTLQLVPALNIQGDRDSAYKFNTEDVWKRYYIHYTSDFSDLHCVDGVTYDNHDAEYSTENLNVVNQDLKLVKGLRDVNIPFALGARKEKLNWLEELAKEFFEAIDAVTGLFGGGTNFASQIGSRKDCMKISQQFFSTTKLLWTIGGKQPANYFNYISARALWNKFHYINQIQINGWIEKENARTRIRKEDFVTLLDNNFADIDGVGCEVMRLEWYDEKSDCTISYREPSQYAVGKVQTITIND